MSDDIDFGAISEALNNKTDLDFDNMNPSDLSKETIIGWMMPDYANAIVLTSTETTYTPTVNGYFKVQPSSNMYHTLKIDVAVGDESFNIFLSGSYDKYDMTKTFWIPIAKGYTYTISHPTMVTFVPMKID